MKESGLDPLVVAANADSARGLPHQVFRSSTPAEAAAKAAALLADRRSIDLGLVGINNRNLARDGLTLATAFDACSSIRAAYHHLAGDFEAAAWSLSHARYNCGRFDCGAAYAASIQNIIARVRTVQAAPAADVRTPNPPSPPGMEDALHPGPPASDADDGMSDALHHPSQKDNAQ